MIDNKSRGKQVGNGVWAYGYYACKILNDRIEHFVMCETLNGLDLPSYFTDYEVDPKTVGRYSGLNDKYDNEIYEGDIIELINEDGEIIRVVCEFGTARREMCGRTVDITGFYFTLPWNGRKTFPIVNNYAGKHDLDLFEVIGNIHDNPELLNQ
jgi:uncharacterized phage protein (TIGR01671 family)